MKGHGDVDYVDKSPMTFKSIDTDIEWARYECAESLSEPYALISLRTMSS